MKILFIGGTGNISHYCVKEAVKKGHEVYVLNRGSKPIPDQTTGLVCDINNMEQSRSLLADKQWDSVCDFISFTPDDIKKRIELFAGRTAQYVFISTASAYQKPPNHYIITEETPLENPYWQYSRNKIDCEQYLIRLFEENGFPVTIVRPSFTYSHRWIPTAVGCVDYTTIAWMKQGRPIIVPGSGQSLWVLTHSSDFAAGLAGLLGNRNSIGEDYHITADEVLTWEQIYKTIAQAAGVEANLVYIPVRKIAERSHWISDNLLGDKMYSMVFDNTKIKKAVPSFKAAVPFSQGIKTSIKWHEADPERMKPDPRIEEFWNSVLQNYEH